MGRRFSSHGLLISHACGVSQILHRQPRSSSLLHRASALRVGISPDRLNEPRRSAGGRFSICFNERSSRQHPPPLASTSFRPSAAHPKMHRFRSAALHKLRSSARFNEQAAVHSLPFGILLRRIPLSTHVLQVAAFEKFALHRQLLQLTASTNRARPMLAEYLCRGTRPESRFLSDADARSCPDRSLDDLSGVFRT
jgi:hypothetical protein